jgi:hypothetical protein
LDGSTFSVILARDDAVGFNKVELRDVEEGVELEEFETDDLICKFGT